MELKVESLESKEKKTNLPNHQTKPLDYSVKLWIGNWFVPEIGGYYLVPENSAEHTVLAGQIGKCIGRRVSQFDMSWALMHFPNPIDDGPNKNPSMWIRTPFLIEADDE